jgi:hypothetical protein
VSDDPGFCEGCCKDRDEVIEDLCPSCWRFYYPEAADERATLGAVKNIDTPTPPVKPEPPPDPYAAPPAETPDVGPPLSDAEPTDPPDPGAVSKR